jgi:hypothetical protein
MTTVLVPRWKVMATPEHCPPALSSLWAAVEVGVIDVGPSGYRARGFPDARFVAAARLPPHDGVYRASYWETGIYVRLDLAHADVPVALAVLLRKAHPGLVGEDGALYEYERETRSQRTNRDAALRRLANRIAEARATIGGGI